MSQARTSRLTWIALAVACVGFAAALSGYAATGANMRYSGDDYCYSANVVEHGFWQTQVYAYLYETAYGGNRFTLNLAAGVSSLVGPMASAVLPGLIMALWVGGMTLCLRELARTFHWAFHPLGWLLASGAVAFFVLHNTPNLDQSFLWRSALLTYLLPMTVNTYLAALVLNRTRSACDLRINCGLVFLFAFLSAGFSETVTALQAGIYILALAVTVLTSRHAISLIQDRGWSRRAAWLAGATLLGTLLAMVVLALSPANPIRQSALPHPPGLASLVRMSLYNAYIFTRISLSKGSVQILLAGLLFAGLGCLFTLRQTQKNLQFKRTFFSALGCLAAGYMLIVCAVAPSAYGESSYPDLRALITPWWVLIIETGILGWLAGQALTRWLQGDFPSIPMATFNLAAILVILAVCALPVVDSIGLYAQLPRYQRWARYWDARNAVLLKARDTNTGTVEVMQIDHIINDVSELSPNPSFWYNVCAARYYGVKQIVADLPGWDK